MYGAVAVPGDPCTTTNYSTSAGNCSETTNVCESGICSMYWYSRFLFVCLILSVCVCVCVWLSDCLPLSLWGCVWGGVIASILPGTSMWGVYSKTCIHLYNISFAHSLYIVFRSTYLSCNIRSPPLGHRTHIFASFSAFKHIEARDDFQIS